MGNVTACSVPQCEGVAHARGWCPKHYQRQRLFGSLEKPPPKQGPRKRLVGLAPCSIPECKKPVQARTYCAAHLTQFYRHGDPLHRGRGEVRDGKRICATCRQDIPIDLFATRSRCRPCDNATQRRRAKLRYQKVPRSVAECDFCGLTFSADARRSIFCSQTCGRLGAARRNRKNVQARKLAERLATTEHFDPAAVFARDSWTCGICLGPIDRLLTHPDPQSPSVDHVIPISRGGKHCLDNVQAAHLRCNLSKGSKLI